MILCDTTTRWQQYWDYNKEQDKDYCVRDQSGPCRLNARDMQDETFNNFREKVFSKYPFSLSNEEIDILEKIKTKRIPLIVEELRLKLNYLGNRCAVFAFLKNDSEENKVSDIDYESDPLLKEYAILINSSSNIWELMGFVSLLEMDAVSMLISILLAQSDVERKMLSKHAYTIVYEARHNNLFQKVSKEMKNFPESLLSKKDNDELWTTIKKELKSMSDLDVENSIRNHIDAHKSSSFECQYETFRSCGWGQAVYDLIVLIQVSDRLLGVIESIFSKLKHEINEVTDRIKTRVERLDAIIEMLK